SGPGIAALLPGGPGLRGPSRLPFGLTALPRAVERFGDRPERRAGPAPHATAAALDGIGRVAADPPGVAWPVQIEQAQPEPREGQRLLAGDLQEVEVGGGQAGADRDDSFVVQQVTQGNRRVPPA